MLTPLPSTYTNWGGKSEKNILASSLLINNGLSNQSVHCSYYSCVQYVFHVMTAQFCMEIQKVERQSESFHNGVGTHKWLRDYIYDSIKNTNKAKANIFYEDMWAMSKARNKADYNHNLVFQEEAEMIKQKPFSTINLLKGYYEI